MITGSMYAGKTTMLLNILINRQNYQTIVFKHAADTRYSANSEIITNGGLSFPCVRSTDLSMDIVTYGRVSTIAVDEGQFFPNLQEKVEQQWAACGKEVIITAVKTDCFMQPLKPIALLIAAAEKVTVLNSVCSSCFGEAAYTYRLTPFPEELEPSDVGFFLDNGSDYLPHCRRCFLK